MAYFVTALHSTSRKANADSEGGVTMLACDVTNDTPVADSVSSVLSTTGRTDLLINNAGIGMFGGAEESSVAQVQTQFYANLFGMGRIINDVLPSMQAQGRERIVNMSSILGVIPAPYSEHYSAVKHAVEGYSESLDHEVRAFGIRVSVIEPAFVRTVFDQHGMEPDSPLRNTIGHPRFRIQTNLSGNAPTASNRCAILSRSGKPASP